MSPIMRKALYIAAGSLLPSILLGGFLADGMGIFVGIPIVALLAFGIALIHLRLFPRLSLWAIGGLVYLSTIIVLSGLFLLLLAYFTVFTAHLPAK